MSGMEMSSMTATVSSEVTVYGAVGAVFLFLLVALLLGLSFSSPCKASDESKYLSNNVGGNNLGYDRDQVRRLIFYLLFCPPLSLFLVRFSPNWVVIGAHQEKKRA